MFEGLDRIDWTSLEYHVYAEQQDIPDAIRRLLSQDPDVRDEARGFLLGQGQDYGDIYDTTSFIIPFVFEILGSPDGPGKEDLLDHLSAIARHIREVDHPSVRVMRLYLVTYNSLKAGLPILISLLAEQAVSVRLAAIEVLQYLGDDIETLLPEFIKHFQSENREDVQLALLRGLKMLLSSLEWTRPGSKERCEPFLNEIVESHPSRRVRSAAAQAAVEIFEEQVPERTLSPEVEALLSGEFWRISKSIEDEGWSDEFDQAITIIRDLVKLEAADQLLDMLGDPEITPVQAHLIGRGLLALLMTWHDDLYWDCDRNYYAEGREFDYVHSYPLAHNLKIFHQHRDHFEQRFFRLLEGIVENRQFWEIPTNMFSFFAGLPDSRKELRAILKPNRLE